MYLGDYFAWNWASAHFCSLLLGPICGTIDIQSSSLKKARSSTTVMSFERRASSACSARMARQTSSSEIVGLVVEVMVVVGAGAGGLPLVLVLEGSVGGTAAAELDCP